MLKKYSVNLEGEERYPYIIVFLLLLVYAGTLFYPLLDKDAAHHANIALYMYEHNDWASLVDRQKDYLDKPHFLFWTSLLSFKIFGINTFAHRFPHILFALGSVYATYKLGKHVGGKTTGLLAAILLGTAQAFVLSVSDARMETPLTFGIIIGIWQLILYMDREKFLNLVFAALAAAIAFATKGWIGPIVIFITIFFYLLTQRKWRVLISFKTWLFVPLFFLFISPVLYAYYLQFDLHPEKVIRGRSNISGVKFILWDQLFERSQGFDVKGRNSEYFFLYHTFLWAFFPWSIIACVALFFWLKRIFYKRKWRNHFSFAALSFAFILFAISFSKFKMPHYIIMLLPIAALFTAAYVKAAFRYERTVKFFYPLQTIFAWIILPAVLIMNFYFFKPAKIFVWFFGIVLLAGYVYWLLSKQTNKALKTIFTSAALSLLFNFFLFHNFFPNLLKYQGGKEMVKLMEREQIHIPGEQIILVESGAHSFDFYLNRNHDVVDPENFEKGYQPQSGKRYLITSRIKNRLTELGFVVEPVVSAVDYNVATPRLNFLVPSRRKNLDSLYLAKISKP